MKNILIINKGNKVYYGLMMFFVVITILGCILFRCIDMAQCRNYLIGLNVISMIIMVPYRIKLVFDKEYMDMCYPNVKKSYLFELPFFPCNTAEILFLFAYLTNSKILLSYCFFMGLFGPIMAFAVPALGFENKSLFHYRIFGFYIIHYICLMNIPLMMAGQIFIPTYYDVLIAMLVYALISFVMYVFNLYINTKELGYTCNYFFNTDPNYHPVFMKIYTYIPHGYVFTIPLMVLVGLVFCILVFIIQLFI